jgi:hypothetical protein
MEFIKDDFRVIKISVLGIVERGGFTILRPYEGKTYKHIW